MNATRWAIGLIFLAYLFLIPGLYQPLMTITASVRFLGISQEIFRQTRSILGTVEALYHSGNYLVAVLIVSFSLIIPSIKALLLLLYFRSPMPHQRQRLDTLGQILGKWSMADVFVIGILVAFMSANAVDSLSAELHAGFYYFTLYCLLSMAASQWLSRIQQSKNTDA